MIVPTEFCDEINEQLFFANRLGGSYVGQKMALYRLHSFCITDFIVYLHKGN